MAGIQNKTGCLQPDDARRLIAEGKPGFLHKKSIFTT
jgi:hypothetical protein